MKEFSMVMIENIRTLVLRFAENFLAHTKYPDETDFNSAFEKKNI